MSSPSSFLVDQAATFAQRTAIVDPNGSYTYQELLMESHRVGSGLLAGRSDLAEERIAFLIEPGFDYVKVQWAIWRAGGIAVPLCTAHPLPAIEYVLKDAEVSMVIAEGEYYTFLLPLADQLALPLHQATALADTDPQALPKLAIERAAMILYTSGTTNLPKGVVSTHASLSSQIQTLVEAWAWESTDHILNILPLHHVHGIVNILSCALWSGACCQFLPKFEAKTVWELFCAGKINLFMAVPTIYFKLIAYWEAQTEVEQAKLSAALRQFRLMVSGSAALPVSVLEKWKGISGHTLLERYGMTEIGMALSNPYEGERRPGHVGLPLPGVNIRLVDEQGQEVKEGEVGEIQVQSPNLFACYWNKPEATAEAFQGNWFCTGDMAQLNRGYYKILGRSSVDIIKSGGYKISALEIEDVLRKYPGISDCGVVGLPDEEWGELVAASLVLENKSLDLDALDQWLRTQLPAYKLPRKYIIQDDLPRNTIGKVTKKALKDCFN